VVGCLPAFAVIYRQVQNKNKRRHQSQTSNDTPALQHPHIIHLSTATAASEISRQKMRIEATRATHQSMDGSRMYHNMLKNHTRQDKGASESSDVANSEFPYNNGVLSEVS
jgi:hypothetical protein